MTDPATGRVGYTERGMGSAREEGRRERFPAEHAESPTALAVLARLAAGGDPSKGLLAKGIDVVAATRPRWDLEAGTLDFHYWFVGALAMARVGGAKADAWRAGLIEALVPHQRTDGERCGRAGSWDPVDAWGAAGGRVYATAIAVLALEALALPAAR